MIEVQFPAGALMDFFLLLLQPDSSGAHPTLYQMSTGASYPDGKVAGHEAYHSSI
jgi:hypothetical protein